MPFLVKTSSEFLFIGISLQKILFSGAMSGRSVLQIVACFCRFKPRGRPWLAGTSALKSCRTKSNVLYRWSWRQVYCNVFLVFVNFTCLKSLIFGTFAFFTCRNEHHTFKTQMRHWNMGSLNWKMCLNQKKMSIDFIS